MIFRNLMIFRYVRVKLNDIFWLQVKLNDVLATGEIKCVLLQDIGNLGS